MKVRKAILEDASEIHKLINLYAKKGSLLPRSLAEIYESIRDFFVVAGEDGIVATAALKIVWRDLAEIRSLAVLESHKGKGIGKALVEACLKEARGIGVKRVFVLTNIPDYFSSMGFALVDKKRLPQKVWFDCIRCPKFPDCDEVAMILDLEGL